MRKNPCTTDQVAIPEAVEVTKSSKPGRKEAEKVRLQVRRPQEAEHRLPPRNTQCGGRLSLGLRKAGMDRARRMTIIDPLHRGRGGGMRTRNVHATRETRPLEKGDRPFHRREERTGQGRESEEPTVPEKPGNAGGGKGLWFQSATNAVRGEGRLTCV